MQPAPADHRWHQNFPGAIQACRLPELPMPFDIEHAQTLRTTSRRAAIALHAAQWAVLDGIRSQAPVAFMQLHDRSRREATAAAIAAAAAYSLYLSDNSDRAMETARTITDGFGYVACSSSGHEKTARRRSFLPKQQPTD